MIVALIIAATLSSDSIGTFFTLPAWMPQSNISSHDTPGSDPASGTGGWYVAETTNGVVLANTWKIYDSEETLIEDYENPEYQGGGIWYQTYPPRRVEPQEYEYRRLVPDFIEGDENIESMSWDVEYYEPFAMRSYHAIRDRSIGPVPTGRYVPRSPRLTTDVMAGVYSTFDAYCERQYFALQGQSNVWDKAIYGPTTRKHFWFSTDARTITTVTTNFTSWIVEAYVGTDRYRYTSLDVEWVAGHGFDLIDLAQKISYDRTHETVESMDPRYAIADYNTQSFSGSISIKPYTRYPFVATYTASRSINSIVTNTIYYSGSEFAWEPCSHTPTNRTVKTRRLVEYDNICGLADYMTDKWCNYGFAIIGARRPEWIEAINNLSVDDYKIFKGWWSTTDDRIFKGTRIVPSFGWTSSPQSYDWSECSQAFTCLSNDDVWRNNFGSYKKLYQPLFNMTYDIDFSTQKEMYGLAADQVDESMRTMIETNYPHADGWAITNDTRRLFSDRLCCMNQVLGLMDRTYHEPRVIYPNVATNYSYYNEWGCRGEQEVGCVPSYDPETGETIYEIVPSTVSNYVWGTWRETNWLERTDAATDGKAIYHRVSTSSTSSGCGFLVEPSYTCGLTKETVEAELTGVPNALFYGTFLNMYVRDNTIEYCFNVWVQTEEQEGHTKPIDFYVPLHEVESNVTIRADYTYIRNYNVKHPHSEDPDIKYTFGPTQPGRDAYQTSRVKAARAGLVNGVHYREIDCGLSTLPWSSSGESSSSAAYSSEEFNYSSRYDLLLKANSYLGGAYNYAISFWGHDPHNWEDIIPIDSADATRCRGVAGCLNSACLKWGSNIEITEQHFSAHTDSEGIATVDWVETWYNDGGRTNVWVEDFIPTHHLNVFGESPEPYENPAVVRKPFSIDIKAGTMTRTDWNWKTLKRTED